VRITRNKFRAEAGRFTLVDLAITLGVIFAIALLVALILPAFAKAKIGGPRCYGYLRQLGFSIQMMINDYEGTNMMRLSTNKGGTLEFSETGQLFRNYLPMSNYIGGPSVFHCPEDKKRTRAANWNSFGNQNISYFLNIDADETKPQMIWAGDRNVMGGVMTKGNVMLCKSNSVLGWTPEIHRRQGNILMMDGSVSFVDDLGLNNLVQGQFSKFTNQVIRLAIP
jgi:prepilin-type processing-associated H-X9-DG protein